MEIQGSLMLLMGAVYEALNYDLELGDGLIVSFWDVAIMIETFGLVMTFIGRMFGKQDITSED